MKDFDMFLFIPCDLTDTSIEGIETEDGKYLLNKIKEDNISDFKGNYIKELERIELGKFNLHFTRINKDAKALIYITKHKRTKLGMLTMYLYGIKENVNSMLDDFVSESIEIEDIDINNWTKSKNINLLGTCRALVFSYTKLIEKEKVSILACDKAEDRLKGKEFIEAANDDIAQYNGAEVYVSENVLLEVQKEEESDKKKRMEIEAWEVFFMELLILQDAAISRVCKRIIDEFDKDENDPVYASSTDILDSLSTELSESILFLDFNNFAFPTTRIAAEKIAKRFRIDKLVDKYNTYKNLLESLITIRKNKLEDLENNNMNILLLILTLTQILPILASLYELIMKGNLSFNSVISFISSIGTCFIILIVFYYINKRKKKKYSDELLNKNIRY